MGVGHAASDCIYRRLQKDAFQDRFDLALLVSADSDLVSPIRTVRQLFAKKKVSSIFPPGRSSLALKKVATDVLHIGHVELSKSLFPDQVVKGSEKLKRPAKWR